MNIIIMKVKLYFIQVHVVSECVFIVEIGQFLFNCLLSYVCCFYFYSFKLDKYHVNRFASFDLVKLRT